MKGILLVNLGSPRSPHPKDVKRYLKEFLLDPRVIDLPYLLRHALVRAVIIPFRYKASAKGYEKIWTKEGSPLIVYTKRAVEHLQEALGNNYLVEFAMRYGGYTIEHALDTLKEKGATSLTILPLFPQYASATTGSILEKVFNHVRRWHNIVPIRTISHFYEHPLFHKAWVDVSSSYDLDAYDHILFSYHGLPKRQIQKAGYCKDTSTQNALCYKAHAEKTTMSIAKMLSLASGTYTICFQSRLGKEKWLEPYTTSVIQERARRGDKKLLVFSPSFVADCLETYYELDVEAKERFIQEGGTSLDVVRSLNDHPSWINALQALVQNR